MSENNQLEHELNPTAPEDELVTRVWQTRPFVSNPDDLETEKIPERRKNGNQRDPRTTELERLLGCAHRAFTPMTAPLKIDRQIVSAQQNQGETITVPPQPDRQALMPAATGTEPTAELRGYVDCDGRAFDDVAQERQQNAA